jgi:predicted solute-binding protein
MVYAVWAGPREHLTEPVAEAFRQSCRYGLAHIGQIVAREAGPRGVPAELALRYLTEHTVNELDACDQEGLARFLALARGLERGVPQPSVTI